jgi:hypothetical protein
MYMFYLLVIAPVPQQIQNMNLRLHVDMKDINKILANGKTQHIFVETCLHEAVEVSLSCLHFSLMFSEGEVKSRQVFGLYRLN